MLRSVSFAAALPISSDHCAQPDTRSPAKQKPGPWDLGTGFGFLAITLGVTVKGSRWVEGTEAETHKAVYVQSSLAVCCAV